MILFIYVCFKCFFTACDYKRDGGFNSHSGEWIVKCFHVHTRIRGNLLLCGFVGTSFHAPRNCGMAYPRQCFKVDMTWVPSKSASISTLMAGNAPVAPLVLHVIVGGGNHLPSGDPFALYFSIKKLEPTTWHIYSCMPRLASTHTRRLATTNFLSLFFYNHYIKH